jgi:hypothetical protein
LVKSLNAVASRVKHLPRKFSPDQTVAAGVIAITISEGSFVVAGLCVRSLAVNVKEHRLDAGTLLYCNDRIPSSDVTLVLAPVPISVSEYCVAVIDRTLLELEGQSECARPSVSPCVLAMESGPAVAWQI